jgi:anti-sigma factor RsiW
MISRKGDDEPAPTPEQLAAYADGELDGRPECEPLRRHVEAWLARHPEAADDLQAQRRLTRLCRATPPPEPSEAAWGHVLARLERVPLTPDGGAPGRPGYGLRFVAWAAALAATAAAVWLALALLLPGDGPKLARQAPRGPERRQAPFKAPRVVPAEVEPFAVATGDEVEILSIKGADTSTLVVGELPLSGPVVLVQAGEVEVQRVEREVRMGSTGPPMVWAPLASERTEPD